MEFRVTPGADYNAASDFEIMNVDSSMASVIGSSSYNPLVIRLTGYVTFGGEIGGPVAIYNYPDWEAVTVNDGLYIDWGDQSVPLVFKPDFNKGDEVIGGSASDTISGGLGNDVLKGNGGSDTIEGNSNNDRVSGDGGGDTLFGGAGVDILKGGSGNDEMYGGAGNDHLFGGGGDDILSGLLGRDILAGGAGSDEFVFADGFGRDTIIDFKSSDIINLSGLTGFDNFRDVRSHAEDRNGDIIISRGTDKLVIEDHQAADLRASDFLFAEI